LDADEIRGEVFGVAREEEEVWLRAVAVDLRRK